MYPTIEQYKDAIRIAEHSLATLQDYEPVLKSDGEPWFSSGNFAVVFQMKHRQTGKRLALKCFTRHQERREESYRLISEALAAHPSHYLLAYQYLDQEIWVSDHNGDGAEYPLVAMEWAEGMTLGDYVKQHCSERNKDILQTLAHNFEVFCAWLIAQPFAHGDLKPDNIIVRENGSLALVDYDGMFVPTMQGQQAREFGSPVYRHPKRTLDTYDAHIDDFSLLVLLSELRLVAADPMLYNSSLSGESIVAKAGDWQNPNDARILQAMQAQATNGGDLAWVTWAAMLRITAQSIAYQVADWAMVVNTQKQATQKPTIIAPPTIIQSKQAATNFTQNLGSGITLDMIFVEGGTFMMGSNDGKDSEKPVHSVTLDSFYIGKFQVTQAQWKAIMGNNPSLFKGDNLPVEQVSWHDVQEFIEKLNQKIPPSDGKGKYRLLTEAEWEYAARGGNKSKGYEYAGSNNIDEVAWYGGSSGYKTHPVGQTKANELGIFDMSGNVWEWCEDWYGSDYYKNSPSKNPTGASSGSYYVPLRRYAWESQQLRWLPPFCFSSVSWLALFRVLSCEQKKAEP
jgi:formylglycine-generating enzyme required for sulfatase activity